MIVKNIFQILGIVLVFFIIGYVLTFPYELSYNGSDTVILLEDSYEKTSLEELINRDEFKGKVLYIRIWEPFDTESRPYTEEELKTIQNRLDLLKDTTDSNEYMDLAMKVKGIIVQEVAIEEQLDAIETISKKYESSDVAFVFIADPDNDFLSRKDDFRKWKTAVKKYKTPGYHMIMNPELEILVRQHQREATNNGYLPFFLLADNQGKITDYNAPWPQDTTLLYSQINQLLVN